MLFHVMLGFMAVLPMVMEPQAHAVLRFGGGPISHLGFSQNGKILAGYAGPKSGPGEVKVWNLASNKELISVICRKGCRGVALGPDGSTLATWDDVDNLAGRFRLWDTMSGQQRATLRHGESLWRVVFSPDGKALASIGNNHATVWDAANATERFSFQFEQHSFLAFSPSGDELLVLDPVHGSVSLWNAETGRELVAIELHDIARTIVFSRTGRFIAIDGYKTGLKLWEVVTRKQVADLETARCLTVLALAPDGRTLIARSLEDTLCCVDVLTGKRRDVLQNGYWQTVVFPTDNKVLVLWTPTIGPSLRNNKVRPGRVTVLDLVTGTERATMWQFEDTILVISAGGSGVARGEADGTIKTWDVSKLLKQK